MRMTCRCFKLALLGGGSAFWVTLTPLAANAQASNSTEQSDTVQTVVVTAQKRSENLQTVPISAQVVTGAAVQQSNYNSLQDLTQIIPDVHVGDTGSFSNAIYIRGIGSGNNAAFDQSVSTFIDDIYYGRSRLTDSTFLDLSQIELLKGPQSTFFGNNAVAGALNIITTKPSTTTWTGYARALYGSYNSYALEAADGGPLTNWLAVRAAGIFDGNTGWIHNTNTGKDAPDVGNKAGRLTFLATPSSNFDATLKIEATDNLTLGTAAGLPIQFRNCPALPPIGANAPSNYCKQALADNVPQGLHNDTNTGLPGQSLQLSTFDTDLTLNLHALGQTFTSVTGFLDYHDKFTRDSDGTPTELLTATLAERYSQFSQEFRVASATGGRFEYLAGAYFQYDSLAYSAQAPAPFLNVYTALIPALKPLAAYLPVDVAPSFHQVERVYSAFTSVSWNVTDKLKFTGGLRATEDDKSTGATLDYGQATTTYGGYEPIPANLEPLWGIVLGAAGSKSLKRSDAAIMPSAQVQYTFAPQIMAYFSYNRGFKAGGINGQNGLGSVSVPGYGPEFVNAYEVGLKSKWFDNRLLVNLDAFRSDYTDLQVSTELYHPVTNVYSAEVDNAGAARSQGVELETMWVLNSSFRFGANITYLDSKYINYADAAPTTLAAFEKLPSSDLTGQPTNYAPHWSGSLIAQYTQNVTDRYIFKAELTPYLTTSYYTQSGDPFFRVPGYVRLDGRLSLETRDGHWALDLVGKNLTDAVIVAIPGVYTAAKEEPINIAVQLRAKW